MGALVSTISGIQRPLTVAHLRASLLSRTAGLADNRLLDSQTSVPMMKQTLGSLVPPGDRRGTIIITRSLTISLSSGPYAEARARGRARPVDDAVKLKQKPLWRVPLPWKESESEAADRYAM
jgi:hypothetical protein